MAQDTEIQLQTGSSAAFEQPSMDFASLRHEVGQDAVELDAIVETRVRQLFEITDGDRRVFVVQFSDDDAAVQARKPTHGVIVALQSNLRSRAISP